MEHTFKLEQQCAECKTRFTKADKRKEYDPVLVVACPKCSTLLWRPGFGDDSKLFVFNPKADEGI